MVKKFKISQATKKQVTKLAQNVYQKELRNVEKKGIKKYNEIMKYVEQELRKYVADQYEKDELHMAKTIIKKQKKAKKNLKKHAREQLAKVRLENAEKEKIKQQRKMVSCHISLYRKIRESEIERGMKPVVKDYVFSYPIIYDVTMYQSIANKILSEPDRMLEHENKPLEYVEVIESISKTSQVVKWLPDANIIYCAAIRIVNSYHDIHKAQSVFEIGDLIDGENEADSSAGSQVLNVAGVKYRVNKMATTWKEVCNQKFNCDYLNNNFHPYSCIPTAIIAKYHDKFADTYTTSGSMREPRELDYQYVCEIIGLEYKFAHIACSIRQCVKFFQKYNFGLRVFDINMNLIFEWIPTKEGPFGKSTMYMVKHEKHVFMINDADHVKSLANKKPKLLKNILEGPKPQNKETIYAEYRMPTVENETDKKKYFVRSAEKVLEKICKHADPSPDAPTICLEFMCNNPVEILSEIWSVTKGDKKPQLKINNHKLHSFGWNNWDNLIIRIVSVQDDYDSDVTLTEKNYEKYRLQDREFTSKVIDDKWKSHHHQTVLDIHETYRISPLVCRLVDYEVDISTEVCGLDENKAYTFILNSFEKVAKFEWYDVYDLEYDGHELEDQTMYLIEVTDNLPLFDRVLVNQTECRRNGKLLKELIKYSYNPILEEQTTPFKIIGFRRPSQIVDVDFKTPITEIYANEYNLPSDLIKHIVNKTIGCMGMKHTTSLNTQVFENLDYAKNYAYINDGEIFTVVFDDDQLVYFVNTGTSKRLRSGFQSISDMVYCEQLIRLRSDLEKLKKAGIEPLGIRSDCIYFRAEEVEKVKKLFPIDKQMGHYKIERDTVDEAGNRKPKRVVGSYLKVEKNKRVQLTNLLKPEIKIFDSEKEWRENDSLYIKEAIQHINDSRKPTLVIANYGGCGKSHLCSELSKKTLLVAPQNVLCQVKRMEEFECITAHKLLGLNQRNEPTLTGTMHDVSAYDTIIFEEIFKQSPDILFKIYKYMQYHKDKQFLANGDPYQTGPVGYTGHDADNKMMKIINVLFPIQIRLTQSKRLKRKEDQDKLDGLFNALFNTKKVTTKLGFCSEFYDILAKFGFKFIDKETDCSDLNICYYNDKRSKVVNEIVRQRLKHEAFAEDTEVLVKEHFEADKRSFNANCKFKVVTHGEKECEILDLVDKTTHKITTKQLLYNFKLPYCVTCDSVQGVTLKGKFTIWDIGSPYVSAKYVWTMITRATDFDNITVFRHTRSEIQQLTESFLYGYLSRKVDNYIRQDELKKRIQIVIPKKNKGCAVYKLIKDYKDEEINYTAKYITRDWIISKIMGCNWYCHRCNAKLKFIDDTKSNITVNRLDNNLPHLKDNCEIICFDCNRKYQ